MGTLAIDLPDLTKPPYYHPFGVLLKRRFGEAVYKVTLDAGFTCPNIDGSRSTGGCTYCDNISFSPALRGKDPQLSRQLEKGMAFYRKRFQARKFLAYFQTFTNTYAPVDVLEGLYREALRHPDVVGLSIGTRPDCVDEEKLAMIQTLADEDQDRLVCIEYGMQTMHDATGDRINRAHTHAETVAACELTRKVAPDLHLCLHLIAGLPGESPEMVRLSIDECARLRPDSIKFHHCYVYQNTMLAQEWMHGGYRAIELADHIGLSADCIERMPPATAIQRLVGEINSPGVLAPQWGLSKMQVVQKVADELKRRGTWQGVRWAEGGVRS